MSTRATYQFTSERESNFKIKTTIYIHHDGYPAGAACHFYKALILQNQRGNGPEALIRSNKEAEITKSHDIHGDTVFRYNVTGWGPNAPLIAYKQVGSWDKEEWQPFYNGTLADFINEQSKEKYFWVKDYHPFKHLNLGYWQQWLNLDTARFILGPNENDPSDCSIMWYLNAWKGRGKEVGLNYTNMVERYQELVKAFPELKIENFDEEFGVV